MPIHLKLLISGRRSAARFAPRSSLEASRQNSRAETRLAEVSLRGVLAVLLPSDVLNAQHFRRRKLARRVDALSLHPPLTPQSFPCTALRWPAFLSRTMRQIRKRPCSKRTLAVPEEDIQLRRRDSPRLTRTIHSSSSSGMLFDSHFWSLTFRQKAKVSLYTRAMPRSFSRGGDIGVRTGVST